MQSLVQVVELKKVYEDVRAGAMVRTCKYELQVFIVPNITNVNIETIFTYIVYTKDTK